MTTPRYSVEPCSRKELRKLAASIRKTFHLEKELYFPVVKLLDIAEEKLDGFFL